MTRPRNDNTPVPEVREGEDAFTQLSRALTTSPAFATLTAVQMRIYLAIAIRHNGYNNGQIILGVAKAVEETHISRRPVMAAMNRLEELGLVIRRCKGKLLKDENGRISGASQKMASEWEVTDFHTWNAPMVAEDRQKVPPSRLFLRWSVEKQALDLSVRTTPSTIPTRVPNKPKSTRKSGISRPASVSATKTASRAPSRSPTQRPANPAPVSAAPITSPGPRQLLPFDPDREREEILRDDEAWLTRHGSPRPPTQSRRTGVWYYLGERIPAAMAEAMVDDDVPF